MLYFAFCLVLRHRSWIWRWAGILSASGWNPRTLKPTESKWHSAKLLFLQKRLRNTTNRKCNTRDRSRKRIWRGWRRLVFRVFFAVVPGLARHFSLLDGPVFGSVYFTLILGIARNRVRNVLVYSFPPSWRRICDSYMFISLFNFYTCLLKKFLSVIQLSGIYSPIYGSQRFLYLALKLYCILFPLDFHVISLSPLNCFNSVLREIFAPWISCLKDDILLFTYSLISSFWDFSSANTSDREGSTCMPKPGEKQLSRVVRTRQNEYYSNTIYSIITLSPAHLIIIHNLHKRKYFQSNSLHSTERKYISFVPPLMIKYITLTPKLMHIYI